MGVVILSTSPRRGNTFEYHCSRPIKQVVYCKYGFLSNHLNLHISYITTFEIFQNLQIFLPMTGHNLPNPFN